VSRPGLAWKTLLGSVEDAFVCSSSVVLFCELMSAWVLTTARRTICQMVAVMDPATRRAHDAYHRLVRESAWSLDQAFVAVCRLVVRLVATEGRLVLYLDDTLFHRNGPKVEGAGVFRDAVRSTKRQVVYARGLNLVVIGVRVDPPWGGMPLCLPVAVRLHEKDGPTMPELAAQMMAELAVCLPEASFVLCGDGAYATLAGTGLERTMVVSRMRRDAALFGPPPERSGKAGRPRKRGERLDIPAKASGRLKDKDFEKVECEWRGRKATKLMWSQEVLWYRVNPDAMVRLVVVRDPTGHEPDDYFFSSDVSMSPTEIVSVYAGRWGVEISFRDAKQLVGGQEPQSWKHVGPKRAAGLSFWLYSAVWVWYLQTSGDRPSFTVQPWYPDKTTPSFTDAMAELRRTLWRERISSASAGTSLGDETLTILVEALAVAA
jgi:hypothetical protein